MRKLYFSIFTLLALQAQAQIINFPDANFKAKLLQADVTNNLAQDVDNNNIKIDANNDGEIDQAEALLVYRLFYTVSPPLRPDFASDPEVRTVMSGNIHDATGIGYFTNLRRLSFSDNFLTTLDLTGLVYLEYLDCSRNDLVSVNLDGLVSLTNLDCQQNSLETLYVGSLVNLRILVCNENALTELNLSNLANLYIVNCSSNNLASLQFGGNVALEKVACPINQLITLDLSDTAVWSLYCGENPNLTSINVKNGIDSPYDYLMDKIPFPLLSFGFTGLPLLMSVCVDPNEVEVMQQVLVDQPMVGITTDCAPPNVIYFPDIAFKNALLTTNCANFDADPDYDGDADLNNDGEIDYAEALLIQSLYIGPGEVTNLEGLQYFQNLIAFTIADNPITQFSGNGLENLQALQFEQCDITSADLSELATLEFFYFINGSIPDIDFSQNAALHFARFWNVTTISTLNFCPTSLGFFDGQNLPDLVYFSSKNGVVSTDGLWPNTPPPLSPIQLYDCPSIQTICYDPGEYAFINWGNPIDGANYVTDCPADCSLLKTGVFQQQAFAVYPNPAADFLNIETTVSGLKTIGIYNTLGQLVQTEKFDSGNQIRINTSTLITGTYFVELAGDNSKSTQKFIKL